MATKEFMGHDDERKFKRDLLKVLGRIATALEKLSSGSGQDQAKIDEIAGVVESNRSKLEAIGKGN